MTPLSHQVFERARRPHEPRQPLAQAADHARRLQAAIDTLATPVPDPGAVRAGDGGVGGVAPPVRPPHRRCPMKQLTSTWLPRSDFTTDPKGGPYFQLLRGRYWPVNKHGELLVVIGDRGQIYPQCNLHEAIVAKLTEKVPGVDHIERIDVAWAPIRIEDYR